MDTSVQDALSLVIFGVASSGYYLVAAWLERYVSAHWGWLLLAARKPHFCGRKVIPGRVESGGEHWPQPGQM